MSTTAPITDIAAIRALGVDVALPGDPDWDAARQAWTVNVDQRPAAVAFPESADDVAALVRFAARAGLRVAPQGTGHNAAPLGNLAGAILVKTERMRGVRIDPDAMIARAEAGALWEDVVVPAARHGLWVLHGSSPDVGVVGYSLGGGVGWMARAHGLATNSLTAVELVTPDGEFVRADADTAPDLFWALRGGGGNFGIVTAVEIRMYRVEHMTAGWLIFPWERSREVLGAWAEWTRAVPESVTSVGRILQLPPLEVIPEPLRGRNLVVVEAAIMADEATADHILAPLRALVPEMDTFAPAGPGDLARLHQDPEGPTPAAVKHALFDALPPEAVDAVVAVAGPGSGSPLVSVEIRHIGGAAGRPAPDGGALSHLRAEYAYLGVGLLITAELGAAVHAHLGRVHEALAAYASGRSYLNFTEDLTDTRLAYTPEAQERLHDLRRRVDPVGRVRANHPITPAA
jgi:FAD/FMN-containing dehydrogenase